MDHRDRTNEEQSTLWNGSSGQAWVDMQPLLDRVLQPFEDVLITTVAGAQARRVLDVGCGTGSTTLAIARLLGPEGACTGVDISEPMLGIARARAAREGNGAKFIRADAQTHPFEPASVDMIVSRFGVMFFEDPVAAFANLRRAARAGARLFFVAWRAPEDNPFMMAAERAAAPFLPNMTPRQVDVPGPFAFANPSKLEETLRASGWQSVDIRPLDASCSLPESELDTYLSLLGPVGRALEGADEQTRAQVIRAIRPEFGSFIRGTEVRFPAAVWAVGARSP